MSAASQRRARKAETDAMGALYRATMAYKAALIDETGVEKARKALCKAALQAESAMGHSLDRRKGGKRLKSAP